MPMETLWQDLRYSLRVLAKAPGFTAVAILTLAIGMGASVTIFSWVRAVLLNPLPGVAEPDRIVALESLTPDADWVPTSYLDFRDLRDNCKLMESMSVAKPVALAVGNEDNIERVWGEVVSGNFFDLLRVKPELGRFFSPAEVDHQQNAHPLAILSHSYWSSHYHADPRVIGAMVRINHFPYTIIGVAPKAFHGSMPGLTFDMWAPATMYGQLASTGDSTLLDRKWRTFRVLVRLAPGVSIEQARREANKHSKRPPLAIEERAVACRSQLSVHGCWRPHIKCESGHRTVKGLGRDPNDRVRKVVDAHHCADDARIGVIMAAPI